MNRKTGLDYFPFDIDFFQDEKIQFVSARFGIKGESIAVRLLCKIYRNGYFTEWNQDIGLLFAKSVGDGCQYSLANDVVHELLKRGFFDKGIFERFDILTSRGIQKRYLEASARRKNIVILADILLADTSCYENVSISNENVYILKENDSILKQSKGKESKEKEKEKESKVKKKVQYQLIADTYNATCISLPKVATLSDARKNAIRIILSKGYSIGDLQSAFEKAEKSSFLKGENNNGWKASFDWLIKDANIAKVLDGNYQDRTDGRKGEEKRDEFREMIEGGYFSDERR
ncbi:DUF4373 domain-containing protein [Lachnospiraceae bacterium ZAX-1]